MSEAAQAVPARPRRRRWRLFVVLFFLTLIGGAWFAPEIISQTSLRHGLADRAVLGWPMRVELGPTSLGWMKPITLRDLKVFDADGETMLTVKEVRSEKTLWQLVTQTSVLGTFTLIEPTGHVVLRADGSNVEDVVAALMSGPSTGPAPEIRVEIVNARIEFEHPTSKQKSAIESLDLKVSSGANGVELIVAEMPSKSATSATDSGRFAAYFGKPVADSETDAKADDSQQLMVRAKDWQLDWLNPVLARWQSKGNVSGMLSADCRVSLGTGTTGKGTVSVHDLRVAGLSGMGTDQLQLAEVSLCGSVSDQADRLILDAAELRTEVGTLKATGNVPVSGWSFKSMDEALRKIGRETFRVDGDVDLAKLAALLPQTLAVREGTRIDGGSVNIAVVSQPEGGHEKFQARVEIARLSAVADGRRFEWDVPLQALVSTHRDGDEFVFDRVACRSDFLQADAKGTLTDATFQLKGDLDKLNHNLSRFFDFGIERLSGQVTASGHVQRRLASDHQPQGASPGSEPDASAFRLMERSGGNVELKMKTELTKFELKRRGESPWREEQLEIIASSSARLSPQQQLKSVESASLQIVSGGDRLDLKLSEPLDWSSSNARWRAVADVVGGLDSWQARLRPVLVVDGWQVGGQLVAHAEVSSDSRVIDVSKLSVAIDNLDARGPEWLIQEPKLSLETAGRWETATSRWVAPQVVVTGTSLAATVSNLDWSLTGANAGASGDARFRVHLGNVSRWKVQAQQQPSYFVAGEATGTLRLQQRGSTTQGTLDARVEKLAIGTPTEKTQSGWETAWQEPEVRLITQAAFDSAKQSLRLSETKLTADGLQLDFAGQVADLQATPIIDVAGEIAYDWDRLSQRLGESIRQSVQVTGQDHRKFALRGRLSAPELATNTQALGAGAATANRSTRLSNVSRTTSPSDSSIAALTGEAGLGWQTAKLYGLTAGAGDVSCKLKEGVGVIALRDLPVNEGTVRLTSQLRLDRAPAMIVLQSERVIDKVKLSPELCAGWLKFVAPIMADATRVDGRFSVVIASGALPLGDPTTGEVAGQFTIHEAELAPGPFAAQVVMIVDRIKALTKSRSLKPADLLALAEQTASPPNGGGNRAWVTLPEQEVPFRMTNGRVFHEGLTLVTKEATLKTRGSVGLDESLDLVIEVPVRDEWIAQNKSLSSLRGKSLQIPVRGSLTQPQLDARVLEGLAREAFTAPVENLLENELQKELEKGLGQGLNRFLPGKKK